MKTTFTSVITALACLILVTQAQAAPRKVFGKNHPFKVEELPPGLLKQDLQSLDPKLKAKAMRDLHAVRFGARDAAEHIRVDHTGGIFIECPDNHHNCKGHSKTPKTSDLQNKDLPDTQNMAIAPNDATGTPRIENAALEITANVPISAPPAFNSKPDSTNHIYLDFNGGIVTGKDWSETYTDPDTGVTTTWTSWDCFAWGTDADFSTFSPEEQADIRRMWERISEDYAPFDVNVTTDVSYDPDNYTGDKNKVGWLMITQKADVNGAHCPHYGIGGVAKFNCYGNSNYFSNKQPAWVNASPSAIVGDVAEAASHEMGHNMGLLHDGYESGAYYGGHVGTTDAPSWGTIMGTGYDRNVSQWSKGEYLNANLFEDDLAIISSKVPYRTDDHADNFANATEWTGSTIDQKGVVERSDNPDYFKFSTAAGPIHFNAASYRCDTGTWGSNLDIVIELYNSAEELVASSNPLAGVDASITYTAAAGDYYLVLKPTGAGNPMTTPRSGYTSYGSLGQYTITGRIFPADELVLIAPNGGEQWERGTSNNITWGSGLGGNVKIELLSNGALHSTIASNTPNNGTYSWSIPGNLPVATNYRVRINSIAQPAKTDTSLADFAIGSPPAYYASMDSDPGWSLGTGWSYGTPTGGGQDNYGNADPISGYNGAKVIGHYLDGDYATNLSSSAATTPAIDCTNYSNLKLSFYRWFGTEGSFDLAYIQVSKNGTNWTNVFSSGSTTYADNEWIYCEYDISAVADGESTVYVRWVQNSDGSWNWSGWNLDEVRVDGDYNEPNIYIIWTTQTFTNPFTDTLTTSDPDRDNLTNRLEFAFGMDPTNPATSALGFTVGGEFTQGGMPIIMNFAAAGQAADFHAVFARRKDYLAAGLTYTPLFSSDMQLWTASASGLSVLTAQNSTSNMEAVSVPFPATVPQQAGGAQQTPRFFRVGVTGGE